MEQKNNIDSIESTLYEDSSSESSFSDSWESYNRKYSVRKRTFSNTNLDTYNIDYFNSFEEENFLEKGQDLVYQLPIQVRDRIYWFDAIKAAPAATYIRLLWYKDNYPNYHGRILPNPSLLDEEGLSDTDWHDVFTNNFSNLSVNDYPVSDIINQPSEDSTDSDSLVDIQDLDNSNVVSMETREFIWNQNFLSGRKERPFVYWHNGVGSVYPPRISHSNKNVSGTQVPYSKSYNDVGYNRTDWKKKPLDYNLGFSKKRNRSYTLDTSDENIFIKNKKSVRLPVDEFDDSDWEDIDNFVNTK